MAKSLKYLFTVLYKDGSVFHQCPEDVSAVDPRRSAYTDALHRIENGKFVLDESGQLISRHQDIYRFMLLGTDPEGKDRSFMVDLVTGDFEIDCASFRIHDRNQEFGPRNLIFFRNHTHTIQVKTVIGQPETAQLDNHSEEIVYRIGWGALMNRREHREFVIEID
jgi:hypothetical protein